MSSVDSLPRSFQSLDDPRHGATYPLSEILVLTVCATLCGADTFVEVEEFGEAKLSWLRGLLPFDDGIPSHDTIGRVFGRLDPGAFEDCFQAWTRQVAEQTDGEVVAVDGKKLAGSAGRGDGEQALNLVEAWATEQHLTLGQHRSSGGPNEIETIPRLLEKLVLEGCIVTTDAMGCQTQVVEAVIGAEADYVVQVKTNQGELYADLHQLFARLSEQREAGYTDVDGGHGRVETRRCWALGAAGRGLIDDDRWAGLQSVVMVETERFVAASQRADASASDASDADVADADVADADVAEGETSTCRRYFISSLPADPQRLLEATRQHWRIENQLHWTLDVAFAEDHSQIRWTEAAENLARVRRMALTALNQDEQVDAGIEAKRKRAGWDSSYLEHLLDLL